MITSTTPHCAMCVIKTWLNGWTTSYRMHEPFLRSCIFGCVDQPDTTSHYVCSCEALWRFVSFATNFRCDNARSRLALSNSSSRELLNLTVAFTVYHCAKSAPPDSENAGAGTRAYEMSLAAFRRFAPAFGLV